MKGKENMKQYFNISDNNCPTCGGSTTRTDVLFLDGMIRVDSTCDKCGHSLMTLYQIESVVDDDEPARLANSVDIPVRAEISHCVWTACDEFLEGESDYTSDCSLVLDEIDFDRLPLPENIGQACADDDMDCIYEVGVKYGIFDEWNGPYNVYINEDDYEEYYEARKELEGSK